MTLTSAGFRFGRTYEVPGGCNTQEELNEWLTSPIESMSPDVKVYNSTMLRSWDRSSDDCLDFFKWIWGWDDYVYGSLAARGDGGWRCKRFKIATDLVGVGPKDLRKDDLVVYLFGSLLFCALRPANNRGTYTLVGEVIIPDLKGVNLGQFMHDNNVAVEHFTLI